MGGAAQFLVMEELPAGAVGGQPGQWRIYQLGVQWGI